MLQMELNHPESCYFDNRLSERFVVPEIRYDDVVLTDRQNLSAVIHDIQARLKLNFRAYVTSRLDRFDSEESNPSAKKRSGSIRLSVQMQLRRQRTIMAVTLTVQDCFCLP
jgi:hypothetical protein